MLLGELDICLIFLLAVLESSEWIQNSAARLQEGHAGSQNPTRCDVDSNCWLLKYSVNCPFFINHQRPHIYSWESPPLLTITVLLKWAQRRFQTLCRVHSAPVDLTACHDACLAYIEPGRISNGLTGIKTVSDRVFKSLSCFFVPFLINCQQKRNLKYKCGCCSHYSFI